jgi:predicted homoserine dehydrogenase-like protein
LLIGLVSWARNLGLDVVCGGKAHARDLVYDETGRTVTDGIKTVNLSDQEMAVVGGMPPGEAGRTVAARRTILRDLVHVSEADLCESVIAANATALVADKPGLHGPVARITEIPDVLSPREAGGVLDTRGAIDVVICLRRWDEAGLAGGVFVVFACANEYTWSFLKQKGIVASRQGNYGLIYRPYHLLGVETPISILCAGLLKISTGGLAIEPRVDLVARAAGDLKAGAIVEVADEGCATPLEPLILPAARVEGSNPLPLHMAAGNRLSADVPAGRLLTSDVIQAVPGSRLRALRREQESAFKIA